MEIVLTETAEKAAALVAGEILCQLAEKKSLVLGLATGSTPIGVYRQLIDAHARGEADFSSTHTFNLDEYMDLPEGHEQSYRYFMDEHLFRHINIPQGNIHFPPASGNDLEKRCQTFEQGIRDVGGIDIQILGIGSNGHIGFNEPTSSLMSRTRVKTLAQKTLRDNSRFYQPGEQPPELAVTMGIGTILDAKTILLQAFGKKKANAIQATVEGPVSSFSPGSVLQLHANTTLYLDPESSSQLKMREYYQDTRKHQDRLRQDGRL